MMMTYEPFDVVVVPFPFVDSQQSKERKALVLSAKAFNLSSNATVLAMITSASSSSWDSDVPVTDLQNTGLKKDCYVRFKLFTIQNFLIKSKVGTLNKQDKQNVKKELKKLLAFELDSINH